VVDYKSIKKFHEIFQKSKIINIFQTPYIKRAYDFIFKGLALKLKGKKGVDMRKIIVLMYAGTLLASGFQLSGTGARELQLGGSDIVNTSMWTAPFWNPALMANSDGNQIGLSLNTIGLQGMYVMNTGLLGYDGGYRLQDTVISKRNILPVPGFGLVRDMGEGLKLGFMEFTPFGLGGKWNLYKFPMGYYNTQDTTFEVPEFPEDNWQSDLKTYALYASFAYRITEKLKIGISGGPLLGSVKLSKVTFVDPATFDSAAEALPIQYRLLPVTMDIDASAMGYGANLGLAYNITKCLSAGLVFRYYSTLDFSGDAAVSLYLPKNDAIAQRLDSASQYLMSGQVMESQGTVEAPFNLPYEMVIGLGYKKAKLGIYTSFTYIKWSKFDNIAASFDSVNILGNPITEDTIKENFKDAYKFALGIEYAFTPLMDARIGFYYDQTPAPDETFTPLIPDINNKIGINFGIGRKISDNLKILAGGEYVYTGERNVERHSDYSYESDNMPGTYKLNVMAGNISIVYSF